MLKLPELKYPVPLGIQTPQRVRIVRSLGDGAVVFHFDSTDAENTFDTTGAYKWVDSDNDWLLASAKVGSFALGSQVVGSDLPILRRVDSGAVSFNFSGEHSFSLSFWYKRTASTADQTIFEWSDATNTAWRITDRSAVSSLSPLWTIWRQGGGSNSVQAAGGPLLINTWYSITVWLNSHYDTMGIQVSNRAPAETAFTGNVLAVPAGFVCMGNATTGMTDACVFDEMCFWPDRVLSPTNRAAYYNNNNGVVVVPS